MADPKVDTATTAPNEVPIALIVNGEQFAHKGDKAMPLLWYLRDVLALTGTKYACDDGSCGACTVLVDGKPVRSCRIPVGDIGQAKITTVEGLADRWRATQANGERGSLSADSLHPLQQAFIDHDAIQCGYCLPGFLMAATALLERKRAPADQDIESIDNLCRCCMYPRIRAAIQGAAAAMREAQK